MVLDLFFLLGYTRNFLTRKSFNRGRKVAMKDRDRTEKERTDEYEKQNRSGQEEHTMEEKRSHSGEKLNLLMNYMSLVLENSHEAITIIQDERYKYINQKTVENRGYTPEEMYNKHIRDIVHPDDYERIRTNYYKRLRGEVVEKYPYRIIDKFGNIKWEELSGVETLWDGKPAALNFITDITRRVDAEEALKKSERQLSDIIDFLPVAIFAINAEGKVIAWNRLMHELSGVAAADMIGKGDLEYALPFHGRKRPMLIDLITRPDSSIEKEYSYFKKRGNTICAEKCVERNGVPLWLRVESSLMFDHNENVIGAIESIQDITELKNVQEELKEKSSHLGETNTALRVLLKRREDDRNEIEQKFISNINELVLPYLEKLRLAGLSKSQAGYLSIIEEHLTEVLSPFLMKMAQKHSRLTPREIEIASLVKDGKTTKEIAEILHIEINTINNHRRHLRKKMGLNNKEGNLRSYLLSFQ